MEVEVVVWSHNMTTKGLRQVQMRENAVKKWYGTITVEHIDGEQNLVVDTCTKEE
jgi:hypothetical protein